MRIGILISTILTGQDRTSAVISMAGGNSHVVRCLSWDTASHTMVTGDEGAMLCYWTAAEQPSPSIVRTRASHAVLIILSASSCEPYSRHADRPRQCDDHAEDALVTSRQTILNEHKMHQPRSSWCLQLTEHRNEIERQWTDWGRSASRPQRKHVSTRR